MLCFACRRRFFFQRGCLCRWSIKEQEKSVQPTSDESLHFGGKAMNVLSYATNKRNRLKKAFHSFPSPDHSVVVRSLREKPVGVPLFGSDRGRAVVSAEWGLPSNWKGRKSLTVERRRRRLSLIERTGVSCLEWRSCIEKHLTSSTTTTTTTTSTTAAATAAAAVAAFDADLFSSSSSNRSPLTSMNEEGWRRLAAASPHSSRSKWTKQCLDFWTGSNLKEFTRQLTPASQHWDGSQALFYRPRAATESPDPGSRIQMTDWILLSFAPVTAWFVRAE